MNYDPNTGQPINNNVQTQTPPQTGSNGFAIAGLIVSIFVSALIGLILSIVGLSKAKQCNGGKGIAIAGIIVSILKMIITLIVCIFFVPLILAVIDVVANQVEACQNAYSCVENGDGTSNCKYKKDNFEIDVTCPTISKSEPTTTTTKTTTDKSKVEELKVTGEGEYYADKFYLKDGNVYARATSASKTFLKNETPVTINGESVYKILYNVKKMFLVEAGQAGYEYLYVVDGLGDAYSVKIIVDTKGDDPFSFTKVKNAKNIAKVYSLLGYDAVVSVFVNEDGQLVPTDDGYIEIDKKNKIYENKVGNDVVKAEFVKEEKGATSSDPSKVYFDIYVNGKKKDKQAVVEFYDDVESYDDIEAVFIPYEG